MELGIITLSDLQRDPTTDRRIEPRQRLADTVGYAELADTLGLNVFGLGEHHSADFAVPSPAVVLAAIATRTSSIRLTSAVTVLSVLDPVRVYEDFATLDLLSGGRAELIVGRSAFTEPFVLFGIDLDDYDAAFDEKLDLLLRLREQPRIARWQGRFKPPLQEADIIPRAIDLPVWVGVGGSPGSPERAGRLGLPMTLGLIGGSIDHARRAVDAYRAAGEAASHADRLRVAISTHFYAAGTTDAARDIYPYYSGSLLVKVTVFGATAAIGRLVVDDLLQAGHDVVAYVRNPDKVPPHWPTDRVDIVVGAITAPAAVDEAVRRGQAVISALGPDMSRKATGLPLVDGARLIVTSMQRHQIQRFIGMATPSVLDPRDRRTLPPRVSTLLARTFLPRAYDEIVGMSNIIMGSDRTWTLVRFLAPRDGAAKRHVRSGFFGTDRIGWTITRADIAHFLTGQLDDQRYLNAAPAVSN